MHSSEHAVCVAINDNNRAWYEMLVPFLLSLRHTGYDGRIAVIGYGLSERKRQILASQAVDVIEASGAYALPVGRFIEAAEYCARHPQIRKLALYDADIWFCAPGFDLFSQIGDDRIHACPDPLFCTFVVTPLIGERRDHHWRLVVDEVSARHGGALQAGLVAGTADAWTRYAHHLRDCIARIGTDFQECFGIDTTFLHLWGAQGETALLDPVQNFVSKYGIHEAFDASTGTTTLRYHGEPIRALHMTGDIRFLDRWRYYPNHTDAALRDGMPFALSDGTPAQSDTVAARIAATGYVRSAGRGNRGKHRRLPAGDRRTRRHDADRQRKPRNRAHRDPRHRAAERLRHASVRLAVAAAVRGAGRRAGATQGHRADGAFLVSGRGRHRHHAALDEPRRPAMQRDLAASRGAGHAAVGGRPAAVQLKAAHTRYAFNPTITTVAAPATIRSGGRIA
ncbi:hypothetical protein [Burkholderia sp. HI2500]|uniref:hypothetical protein n=1 Tax=Burkholderia sp. HI2500 TaxID=2015358 RepID=UPI00211B1614|nr:hypothetical protein [Burkholderia sp. HI2500]